VYEGFLDKNMIIREWLNGSLIPLTVNLTLIIGLYLGQCFLDARRSGLRLRDVPGVHTAAVLFWIFFAESVRAASTWVSLRAQNGGGALSDVVSGMIDMTLAFVGVILVASILRCTYLFTPPRVRHAFWVYSLAVTVGFVSITRAFPHFLNFGLN